MFNKNNDRIFLHREGRSYSIKYNYGIKTVELAIFTKTILQLPTADQAAYKGNPTLASRPNTGEYYAYVNFFATDNDSIRKVVFSNAIATGFESDNHAVATTYNSIRGVGVPSSSAVPEPLTILGALTAMGFGVVFKRHAGS